MKDHHWHSVGAHCPACPCKAAEGSEQHIFCEWVDSEELQLRRFMMEVGIRVRK